MKEIEAMAARLAAEASRRIADRVESSVKVKALQKELRELKREYRLKIVKAKARLDREVKAERERVEGAMFRRAAKEAARDLAKIRQTGQKIHVFTYE
jgi:intein/homing endonuclease